jgi:TPR repeat protein
MTMRAIFPLAAASILLVGTAPFQAGDAPAVEVKAGVDAWSRGDYRQAVDKWRPAAVAGDADAQFNLAQAYKLGRGVPTDLGMAEEWYRRAALQGHRQAEENYGLALFQNDKRNEAVPWLEKSVARSEPRSQFVLGTMLFNGDAVPKDWVRAYALMIRANASGLPQAAQTLAQMDKYIGLAERQKGIELARRLETETGRAALASADLSIASQAQGGISATQVPPSQPAPVPSPAPTPAPKATATPAPARPAPVPTAAPRADGGWRVQLGAFREASNARNLWAKASATSALKGTQPEYPASGGVTRLLAGPFPDAAATNRACTSLKSAGYACLTVRK